MNAAALRRLGRTFIGYVFTGGLAAVVDLGVFAMLLPAGVPLLPAAALSFTVAALVNYQLSARMVFRRETHVRGQALFFAVALIGLAVNVSVTVIVASSFAIPAALAKVAGIGVAFLVNFALNLMVVFRD